MSHTQDKEEMKTSIEDQYRASLQCHQAAIVVLSLLLMSIGGMVAGVLLTGDGLGLCEQKDMASVPWPLNPSTENGQRVKRTWRDWERRSKTLSSTQEPPNANNCNYGCQPIAQNAAATSCPPGCDRQCTPGQPGCNAGQGAGGGAAGGAGGDSSCGTAIVVVCDRGGRQRRTAGQTDRGTGPYGQAIEPAVTECLTMVRPGSQSGAVSSNCREVEVTVCGDGMGMRGNV